MKYYVVVISCVFVFLWSLFASIFPKPRPPEKYDNWIYLKSTFVKQLERKTKKHFKVLKIDWFHAIEFLISSAFLLTSSFLLLFDLLTSISLNDLFSDVQIIIISSSIVLSFVFYEVFLCIWWYIADINNPSYKTIDEAKKVLKKQNKNRKNNL